MTKKVKPKVKPIPGSKKAIGLGCTCPAIDNQDFKGTTLSWVNITCPIHGSHIKKK